MDFLRLNRVIDKFIKTELFDGINSELTRLCVVHSSEGPFSLSFVTQMLRFFSYPSFKYFDHVLKYLAKNPIPSKTLKRT